MLNLNTLAFSKTCDILETDLPQGASINILALLLKSFVYNKALLNLDCKHMKLNKKQRNELSKARQKVSKELASWVQKSIELIHKMRVSPENEDLSKLQFCRDEEKKCRKELHNLNKTCYLQQKWVKG